MMSRPRQSRRGFSLVLFCFALVALIAFVSLAVDIGRFRLARTELQNAADAAALASASSLQFLPTDGVVKVQDNAIDTAQENTSIDQSNNGTGARADRDVDLVRDEDIQFGIWRDATPMSGPDFFPLENSGGKTDERREANAVRVWARRCTTYTDEQGEVHTRNTGIPLIFGPVIGSFTGEANMHATVRLTGGRPGYGFIGLDSVKFNGTTQTDSYNAANEFYPGADGTPNQNGSIASNGNITLVGGTTIRGDVHPGVQGSIQPYPLGGNVTVTGYMNPLDAPLSYATPPFHPLPAEMSPAEPFNVSGNIVPTRALRSNGAFQAVGGQSGNRLKSTANGKDVSGKDKSTKFVFNGWTSGSQTKVYLENDKSPIEIWVNGDLKNSAQAEVHITTNNFPVIFHVFGNFDMQGGGVLNDSATTPASVKPANLQIYMCKASTSLDLGGSPTMSAQIMAPVSDVKLHGNGNGAYGFWGSIVGKTLTVDGGFALHYDESYMPAALKWNTKLVE